ncbi:restriction endonuclease subunit S [Shewanella chilikensis]|uniref:Restriction endonuclease subunit S n=1 Tax=Shewanella chilikensis TaxID=558541 RepID=A0A6G7LPG9_9GAMM|nr:restriction endonuclease subunit S [Shewanella chilikensis]QIJ03672.1 restriction endonuclease subunit S [Shewanella chilikensis]
MSQLNYLEKLLDGVEVEWKALGEVCDFKNGFAFKSSLFKEAGLPIIRITNVDGKNISLDDVKYFDPSDYKENTASYEISKGDILIAMSGATTGKIGFYAHESPAYLNQRVGKFLPKPKILNNRYLYHYLLSKVEQIYVIAGGGAQPNLSSNALMAKIEIPIPCPDNPEKSLAIQAEIVRILDAFTAMTAELTAELNMRKKQYNYYRDQLLSFDLSADQAGEGDVEWVKLSTVANIKNGKDWKKLGSGKIPVYGSGGIMQYVDTFAYNKPTVLIPRKGSITNIFYVDEPFWNVDTIYYTELDLDKIIPKFFYYFMTTIDMMQLDTGSGRPSLTQAILNEIKIPLPTLEEQARIISLLDKFDTLTTSLQEGLPREIELRQKQYEYYRDLLLSFPASPAGGPKSHSDEAA